MKKYEKEVIQAQLDNEKAVLKKLEANYRDSLEEINSKIAELMGRADADMQHVIYQVEYQKALKTQVKSILEMLQTNEFETVSEYLTKCYDEGFLGTMYSLQNQGVPLAFPINQEQVVAAIQHETKLSSTLYAAFDTRDLQKKIASEISRGFSTSATFAEISRNVASYANISKNQATRIVRTEGHRITETAAFHAQEKAMERGADLVKVWSAVLDARTRNSHLKMHGEIRKVNERYSNGMLRPGDSGKPEETINCRCNSRTIAKWALDATETQWLGDVSEMTPERRKDIAKKLGIDEKDLDRYSGEIVPINAKNYNEFKQEYNKLWRYEGSALQKSAEERIAGYGKTAKTKEKPLEKAGKSDKIKPDKVVSGHSSVPKKADPGTIIDHTDKDGKVDSRSFYGADGFKASDIHTDDHGNPKWHGYGQHGEHAHDYEWNEDGSLKNKTTRELTDEERERNGDIL